MWRLSGIERDVYLYSTADTRIQDFFLRPNLDRNYRHGQLEGEVTVENHSNTTVARRVDLTLLDAAGQSVFSQSQTVQVAAGSSAEVSFSRRVANARQWSAEQPNLYQAVLELKDASGKVIEATSTQLGFRSVELKNGQLLVNGQRIMVKGANLHEHDHITGHYVPAETIIKDIQVMKQHNLNAIRAATTRTRLSCMSWPTSMGCMS